MSTTFLRVKIRSLAAEARIIRHEENKYRPKTRMESHPVPAEHHKHVLGDYVSKRVKVTPGEQPKPLYFLLRDHRISQVREEARAALLAYGFLRGRNYGQMESFSFDPPPVRRVMELVQKFGYIDVLQKLAVEYQMKPWAARSDFAHTNTAQLLARWMEGTAWPFQVVEGKNDLELPKANELRATACYEREQYRANCRSHRSGAAAG